MPLSRRKLLLTGTAAGFMLTVPAIAIARTLNPSELDTDPFTLGIASGEPTPDGFVLWTRLAIDPLADDGLGGMPEATTDVTWELATDNKFTKVVDKGTQAASPTWGHSIHVEVTGLDVETEYFYRFKVGEYVSQTGRACTLPAADALPEKYTFAAVACSHFEGGYFNAYGALAKEKPSLIVALGDYIYEGSGQPDRTRKHVGPSAQSLANYRQRYAQYKTDKQLQLVHTVAPWVPSMDDHEVADNWADMIPGSEGDIPFEERRENAFRAFYENMPLRAVSKPDGVYIQLYRRISLGKLANFHMLDTRQYRDDQVCGDGWADCDDRFNEDRSILGTEQEKWLTEGFKNSDARWDFIGQQVFFGERKAESDDGVVKTGMDQWDGYAASRARIVQSWVDAKVRNPIVLGGDVHTFWASELKVDFEDEDAKSVGVEFVCTSITSGGDGYDGDPADNKFVKYNPTIKFYNNQRGYMLWTLTPDEANVDLKVVQQVSKEEDDPKAEVRQSYALADGVHTLEATYSRPLDVSAQNNLKDLDFDDIIALEREGIAQ